ncbi:MAG: phosphatase PAP2 family protein [Sphingomicrobium sp.]
MRQRKTTHRLTKAEAKATKAVAPPQHSPPAKLLAAIGKLGDQPPLRAIAGVAGAAGLLTGDKRLLRAGVRMIIAHEVATFAKNLVKNRVNRTRPRAATKLAESKVKLGTNKAKEETSFPSGHSAGSMAVARAYSREFPSHQPAALAAAVGVAAAQVPRRAHYPTDVAAGLLIGLVSEAATNLVITFGVRWLQRARPATPQQPQPRA